MKKTVIISVISCLLCACTASMPGLRVHNAGQPGKQKVDGELYYNDPEAVGHSEQVKHKVIDETHAQIQIPVQYQEKIVALPKKLPNVLKSALEKYDLKSPGKCESFGESCLLTDKMFTLDLSYKEPDCSGFYVASFLIWSLPITIPAYYMTGCNYLELANREPVFIRNPFESLNEKNLGVRISYEVTPEKMKWHCETKYCELTDEDGNPVNQIRIVKKMSVDQKRINQLLSAQAMAAAKRKREEEEAQKLMEQGKMVCPKLYDEWWGSGGLEYSNDIIAKSRWSRKWQTYDCNSWLRRAIY